MLKCVTRVVNISGMIRMGSGGTWALLCILSRRWHVLDSWRAVYPRPTASRGCPTRHDPSTHQVDLMPRLSQTISFFGNCPLCVIELAITPLFRIPQDPGSLSRLILPATNRFVNFCRYFSNFLVFKFTAAEKFGTTSQLSFTLLNGTEIDDKTYDLFPGEQPIIEENFLDSMAHSTG